MIPKEIIDKWEKEAGALYPFSWQLENHYIYIQGRTDQYNEQVKEIERLKARIVHLESIFSLKSVISYLERTKDEDWCQDVVKTKDGKSCVLGHIFDFGGNLSWNWFESQWATEYMLFPVNDGKNSKYDQATPKERCIAYLTDLLNGHEPSVTEILSI